MVPKQIGGSGNVEQIRGRELAGRGLFRRGAEKEFYVLSAHHLNLLPSIAQQVWRNDRGAEEKGGIGYFVDELDKNWLENNETFASYDATAVKLAMKGREHKARTEKVGVCALSFDPELTLVMLQPRGHIVVEGGGAREVRRTRWETVGPQGRFGC